MHNRYILIRHGESTYNVEKKHQGWKKNIDLTEKGINQSQEIAKKINPLYPQSIIASSLLRTKKTAEIIGSVLNVPVLFNEKIIDYRRSARFEGLHFSEYVNDPDYLQWKSNFKSDPNFKLKGGESYNDFLRRIRDFFNNTEKETKGKTIAVVTHRDVIQEAIFLLSKSEIKNKETIDNGMIYVIESSGNFFEI